MAGASVKDGEWSLLPTFGLLCRSFLLLALLSSATFGATSDAGALPSTLSRRLLLLLRCLGLCLGLLSGRLLSAVGLGLFFLFGLLIVSLRFSFLLLI